MIDRMSANVLRVRWLGLDVELDIDDPELRGLVIRHFAPVMPRPGDPPAGFRYVVRLAGGAPFLDGPLGRVALDRSRGAWHAYHRIVDEVFGRVGSHFILHGAAVARDGWALLVSAPSTFGKSTLATSLVARGFGLLADDVAAVRRRGGEVEPSSRAVQLRPGARALLPERLMRSATAAVVGEDEDAWLVDPERWLGAPPPPARILVAAVLRGLVSDEEPGRTDHVEIAVRSERRALLDEFDRAPGIRDLRRSDRDPGVARMDVEDPAALASWLRRHRDDIVFLRKVPPDAPDFDARPRVRRIGPFQAALELTRDMLNRHVGSRLASEFEGSEGLLVAELAGCLRGATCLTVTPGRLEDATTVLVEAFENAQRGSNGGH